MQTPSPPGAGKSSIDLIDAPRFFETLLLEPGETLLDLGCGWGFYALRAAQWVGERGIVFAMDLWEEGLRFLQARCRENHLHNLWPLQADAGRGIPLKGQSVDCILMATVLHDFVEAGNADGVLEEVRRVLKPRGRLEILEFKKQDGPPGPPIHIRLSPKAVRDILAEYGFQAMHSASAGGAVYRVQMQLDGRDGPGS